MYKIKIFIVLLIVFLFGCLSLEPELCKKDVKMNSLSPDLFDKVEPDDFNENECTPKIDDEFIGIRINAPKEVYYNPGERNRFTGAFCKVIICGVYSFDASFINQLNNSIEESITLVAIDTKSHEPYVSGIVNDNPKIPDPSLNDYSPEELEDLYYTGFFNINILDYLGLPEKPATYNVFVTLKEYKSNVVTIKLVEKKSTETD